MTKFRYWRKMTWVILIAGAMMFVLTATGGFSVPTIALSLAVVGVLWVFWYLTQPPWRQGRGIQRRRLQYVPVPFKTPRNVG